MRILLLLFLITPILCFGQLVDTCLTQVQIIKTAQTIQTQRAEIQLLRGLNDSRVDQIKLLSQALDQDSVLLSLKDLEIGLLNRQIELHLKNPRVEKEAWYNSRTMHFIYGMGTVFVSAIVLDKITK